MKLNVQQLIREAAAAVAAAEAGSYRVRFKHVKYAQTCILRSEETDRLCLFTCRRSLQGLTDQLLMARTHASTRASPHRLSRSNKDRLQRRRVRVCGAAWFVRVHIERRCNRRLMRALGNAGKVEIFRSLQLFLPDLEPTSVELCRRV